MEGGLPAGEDLLPSSSYPKMSTKRRRGFSMVILASIASIGLVWLLAGRIQNSTSQYRDVPTKQQKEDPDLDPDLSSSSSFWQEHVFTGYELLQDTDSTPPPQPFAFEAVFGDNMVLQHGVKAAVYGFLGPACQSVQLIMATENQTIVFASNHTQINATQQPFGPGWGVRPCAKEDCPPYDMQPFNPWNEPLPTWKIFLPPQPPGGNFTIEATCLGTTTSRVDHVDAATISITNVTFGDVWYCSGQSNMWLPLQNTFHRNETAHAILHQGKYHQIRVMAGTSKNHPHGGFGHWDPSKYGSRQGSNPWMTAVQAVNADPDHLQKSRLFQFGAACWYFAQGLVDQGLTDIPIGLANTAIGGQRIQEYMENSTIHQCHNRSATGKETNMLYWEGQLYATQVLPFADMSLKGFVWYQGENNMHDVKGNAASNIGYGCEMKLLVQQWRRLWSQTPGTTDPLAPFGIVTLVSSGSEGGPDMGAMRHAQTANYGVLPHDTEMPNTFSAQAYDLDDEWDPKTGPCYDNHCCLYDKNFNASLCSNKTLKEACNAPTGMCSVARDTASVMGAIHPRSKKQIGDRLAKSAYNLFYGGKKAYTGPTLQGCSLKTDGKSHQQVLEIRFNTSLLRGDRLAKPKIPPFVIKPRYKQPAGGSQLWIQTNASMFCMESALVYDGVGTKTQRFFCPSWAGGTKEQEKTPVDHPYRDGWTLLNFSLAPGTTHAIHVDLSPLPDGATPTAVRYAWDLVDCCDHTDPDLFVTHGCIENCPIYAVESKLPANPFQARIVNGKCQCIAPQACDDGGDDDAHRPDAASKTTAWREETESATSTN